MNYSDYNYCEDFYFHKNYKKEDHSFEIEDFEQGQNIQTESENKTIYNYLDEIDQKKMLAYYIFFYIYNKNLEFRRNPKFNRFLSLERDLDLIYIN